MNASLLVLLTFALFIGCNPGGEGALNVNSTNTEIAIPRGVPRLTQEATISCYLRSEPQYEVCTDDVANNIRQCRRPAWAVLNNNEIETFIAASYFEGTANCNFLATSNGSTCRSPTTVTPTMVLNPLETKVFDCGAVTRDTRISDGILINERFSFYDKVVIVVESVQDLPSGPQGPAGPSAVSAIVAADGSGNFTSLSSAVASGAKSILIKNGTYSNTTNIDIGDGTLVRGETVSGVILDFAGFDARISGGSDNHIERVTMYKSDQYVFNPVIDFSGSGNIVVGTRITSVSTCLRTGANCLVANNTMESGSYIIESGNDCRIRENSFRITTSYSNSAFSGDGSGIEITHNSFYVGNASGSALSVGADNLIAYNRFESTGNADGFAIDASDGRIIGNEIVGFETGIVFHGNTTGGVIQGNVIRDSNIGLDVFGPSNLGYGSIVVSGNSILNPTTYGIQLGGVKMTVTGNTISWAGSHCIYGWNSLQWVTIVSNVGVGCGGSIVDVSNGFDLSAQTANVGDFSGP